MSIKVTCCKPKVLCYTSDNNPPQADSSDDLRLLLVSLVLLLSLSLQTSSAASAAPSEYSEATAPSEYSEATAGDEYSVETPVEAYSQATAPPDTYEMDQPSDSDDEAPEVPDKNYDINGTFELHCFCFELARVYASN